MKPVFIFKCLVICCLSYISSACSHQQVPLQTVFSSNDCAIREPTIKSIDTAFELNNFFESMPVNFSQVPIAVPDINYDEQTLILYALGQQPTSGYSIELTQDHATIKKQTLYLPVRVQRPKGGSYQAQLITSPCKIFSLPHADYSEIVVDNNLAD